MTPLIADPCIQVCARLGADADGQERRSLQVPAALLHSLQEVWRWCGHGQVHPLPHSIPLFLYAQRHTKAAASCQGHLLHFAPVVALSACHGVSHCVGLE